MPQRADTQHTTTERENMHTYTEHKHYDPLLQRNYTNIKRDGQVVAQAVTASPTSDMGIVTNVILNGNWGKNQFENTTISEWVARFTK